MMRCNATVYDFAIHTMVSTVGEESEVYISGKSYFSNVIRGPSMSDKNDVLISCLPELFPYVCWLNSNTLGETNLFSFDTRSVLSLRTNYYADI